MKRIDSVVIGFIAVIYILILFFCFRYSLFYTFNEHLIDRYLNSQDIPYEVDERIFLSDSEIHVAAGYLYATGASPFTYNFQHPPLIKYVYGIVASSIRLPYLVNAILGLFYLWGTYWVAITIFTMIKEKQEHILTPSKGEYLLEQEVVLRMGAIISVGFVLIDPIFIAVVTQALLDVGQALFCLLYVIMRIRGSSRLFLLSASIGLAAASKFWTPVIFFVICVEGGMALYEGFFMQWRQRIVDMVRLAMGSAIVFTCVHFPVVFHGGGVGTIWWYQLKIVNYWIHHSVSAMPMANTILFLTGYMQQWWGAREWHHIDQWTVAWPLFLLLSLVAVVHIYRTHVLVACIFAIPLAYLLFISVQAPFARYFFIILPYLYCAGVYAIYIILSGQKR